MSSILNHQLKGKDESVTGPASLPSGHICWTTKTDMMPLNLYCILNPIRTYRNLTSFKV